MKLREKWREYESGFENRAQAICSVLLLLAMGPITFGYTWALLILNFLLDI